MFNRSYLQYIILGGGVIVLTVLLFGVGIYTYHWRGSVVRALGRVVPYPAVLVDWEPVRYWTYVDDLRALLRYWDVQRENTNVFLGIPDEAQIRERLMNKLIEETLVSQFARRKGIVVSTEQVEQEWGRLLTQADAEHEAGIFISEAYGWDEETFKERVLIPFLLRRHVSDVLAAEAGFSEEALSKKARELYTEAKKRGADFEAFRDLGYFGRGTFEPALEEALFGMDIGEISEPIRTSAGWHIVRLDDVLVNENGLAVQAAARQILVPSFNFEAWLEEQKAVTPIHRLIN